MSVGSPVLRLRYRIDGPVRFVGSRDLCRLWERAVRRARVPVAMSQGFTPRPRIAFGLALPTCAESDAEYVDIRLAAPVDDVDALVGSIDDGLPGGIDVTGVGVVDTALASLQESVTAVTWAMWGFDRAIDDLRAAATSALAAEHLFVERERKGVRSVDDVRGHLFDVSVLDASAAASTAEPVIVADVSTTGRSVRPLEVAAVVFGVDGALRIRRLAQWIDDDGTRREVVPPAATDRSAAALLTGVRR